VQTGAWQGLEHIHDIFFNMALIHHLVDSLVLYRDFVFDYDETIAKIPINWQEARVGCREHLISLYTATDFPEGMRMDEMEAMTLERHPEDRSRIFAYRHEIEGAVTGGHLPDSLVVDLVKDLAALPKVRLFILSNNLHQTILNGLHQMGIADLFTAILGVDDIGSPKPSIKGKIVLEEQYGVIPEATLFIGDSPHTDGIFASRANFRFVNIKELVTHD
jgi:HAD superfamily hydrolase (TIGR01549 family)